MRKIYSRTIFHWVLAAWLFLFSKLLLSQTYLLYKSGSPVPNYSQIIKQLKPGDTLLFSDGRSFNFHGYLGNGRTTQIIDIGNGKALRVPLQSGNFIPDFGVPTPYQKYLKEFYDGYQQLKGVPVVKLYEDESNVEEYLVVEKLDVHFTLNDFLKGKHGFSSSEEKAVLSQFIEFTQKFWKYSSIGDLSEEQIVYTTHGWKLLDFMTGNATIYNYGLNSNAFSYTLGLPEGIQEAVNAGIIKEREKHRAIEMQKRIKNSSLKSVEHPRFNPETSEIHMSKADLVAELPQLAKYIESPTEIAKLKIADRSVLLDLADTGIMNVEHAIIDLLSKDKEWASHPEVLETLIKSGASSALITGKVLSKMEWKVAPHLFQHLVKREPGVSDSQVDTLLKLPHWKNSSYLNELVRGGELNAENLRKAFTCDKVLNRLGEF